MPEAAAAGASSMTGGGGGTATAAAVVPTSAGAGNPPASAGIALGNQAADWLSGFKNADLKSYVQERKFTGPEQLAERYQNLEKLKGVPEERLLRLPEKMEGAEAREVWEKLGAPKEAKGYELKRDEKTPAFADWAEGVFHSNNLTKTQAKGVVEAYEQYVQSEISKQSQARAAAISQDEQTLKTEWGQHYDRNINLAKQGARILGLDAQTLDTIEALQGRASLFKTLQKIGVSVGESNFVDGGHAPGAGVLTPEQAKAEMDKLMKDQKFQKKWNRGDTEAMQKWDSLNRAAFPGEKPIG